MLQQENYHFLQYTGNTAPSSGDKEVIITKLITKVSEQALELTDLTTQLERSAATAISQSSSSSSVTNGVYYDLDNLDLHSKHSNRPSPSESSGHSARRGHAFDPILSDGNSSSYGGVLHYDHTSSGSSSKQPFHSLSFSEAATQRKHDQETHQQLLSLQMQLEASEGRLTEAVKARKKMINELETKSRELRFYAKKCKELESENNLLRAQNESILKMQSMSALKSSERKGARGHLLKAVDPVVYYKACDDLSFHKKLVEELQVEIEQLREEEQRSVTRTKLLEEALEFRSEEIGLAGHSDLLSKVVKLRNEVNTLKSELSQKHGSAASGAEEEEEEKVKADTKQQHEVLQRQILQIQARLSKSQQELYTLQHADVHELLRRAEHERDTLLEFVSSDMQKSSDLCQQVDGLQAQLRSSRLNEKTLEVNNERLTKLLSEDKHRSSEVEDRCHTLSVQLQDLSRSHRILEVEKEQLSKQLELKRLEAEEVGKVSSNLYAQSKSKDSELISLANEVTVLTTQLVEYRIVVPRLEEDNKQLRDRCRSSDSETQLLRESLGVFESKLHRLEPELKLLRSERESMLQEKYSLEAEATKLRPLGRILVEMSRDIAQVNEMFSLPSQVSAAARSDRNNNTLHPNKPSSEVEVGDREEDIAALPSSEGGEEESLLQSQKHTLWVGLPSIRALHGGLYENIRRLARDLQEKELQLNETVGKYTSLQKEYHKAKADNEHIHQQLSTLQRESSQVIHQLTESNLKSDKEIVKLRGLAEIIDQIRSSIVNSYPSSIMQLYSRDSIDMGNLTNLPTYEMKTAESSPFSSRNALSPEHWKASNREYLAKEIHDRSLSDLVGKIITYSTASVVDFEASQSTISELQRTVRGLQLQCDELSRYKQDSLQGASAMNSLVHRADERCVLLEKECAEKVTAAVDLAEKQNALTMSLEAKVRDTYTPLMCS